ncbi:ATP-binding cassette domain-containing protein [Acuticoccus mangrovi]|uniref:ABC transporter ATP-binding protein n=1 Tax=Acuticoccus mangrovi TaxID=2796142 RepID=A0A934IMI7_9HYPH|nr:ABC transporter ATP-binding protein [Acuticoccus mangrovi]MBJ3774967.1 ABC transporter ATP-binding protein [Acuticoccus mangrovi]
MLAYENFVAASAAGRLVDGISMKIAHGERVALVGASGSGKSLTGRAALALPPRGVRYSGRVTFEGRDLLATPERELCRLRGATLAMIFQEPATALDPAMRIGAQIEEPLLIHTDQPASARRDRVAGLLERTGLAAAGVGPERYPHELSGGQRQRVAVAIALALKPRVVVADEPTSALDSVSAGLVLDLLLALTAEEGAALLIITHDLAVARRADRIAVMAAGRIAEEGAAADVLDAPKSAAGRALRTGGGLTLPARESTLGAPVLEGRAISVDQGGQRVVDRVDVAVRAGERLALVGGSGSGKTTLMRALLGLVPADGEVRLHGAPVTPDPRRTGQVAQMVFQDPATSFDPRQSVLQIVCEPLHGRGLSWAARREMAAHALVRVGLEVDALARRPHAFSGGQRQRIAIARALVGAPAALVADEAVSALDAAIRRDIVMLLDRLVREEGIALVFIAHDLHLVRRLADRVAVMEAGRIVEEAPTETLFATPRHAATRALLDRIEDDDEDNNNHREVDHGA